MATNFQLKPFRFNISDLNFIRDQIKFKPLFDVAGNAIINWDGSSAVYDAKGVAYADQGSSAANLAAYGTSYGSLTDLSGLRDVSGTNNNLLLVNKFLGAVDQPFLRTVAPNFDVYIKPLASGSDGAFYANKTFATPIDSVDNPETVYTKSATAPDLSVVDYTPRMISQLVTTGGSRPLLDANGQVVHWNADQYALSAAAEVGTAENAYTALVDSVSPGGAGLLEGATIIADYGILTGGQHDPQDPGNGEVFYGAINPGVAPGNSFLAYFGQFFDHGLDFVGKGASGTRITIPLATDDPLYRAPGTNGPGDLGNTKITVSRADVSGFDADGNAQWVNHTSPYIDQSQTYGSHAQMTSLLREWVSTDSGVSYHAGAQLLDGATSAQWSNAWGETTIATLPTLGELNAHLIATGRDPLTWDDVLDLRNRDANGDVATGAEAGTSGQALLLDMNPHFDTAHLSDATQAALALLGILPDGDGNFALGGPPGTPTLADIIDFRTFGPMAGGTPQDTELAKAVLFDSVSDHYIAGDGRANENIALTTIHHVFHEEHNYQVRNIQEAILAQEERAVALGDTSHSVAHDWQIATAFTDANGNYLLSEGGAIAWDDGKLFDAAKLTVEMEYQHAAVDQYARTITPDIAEFVGYNSGENSTVSLEYSQAAFRFGHSTMRETIDMLDPTGSITGKVMSVALEQAFLNPALFAQKGAASIAMGLTHQQMNEIDELLTPAMNTGLLGQPLDLAAINIARGRDVGLPTLNDFREAIGLTRYISWSDFGANMVHPESLVNFIAAYSFDGDAAKAAAIIGLENGEIAEGSAAAEGFTAQQAIDFLSGSDLGFNKIDTWLGGLAEVHVMGGLLGETFNAVFVDQISRLMDGDRFYYLYRLSNLNMGDEIANAQLKDIVERNTGVEHLNGSVFAYADQYIELAAKVDTDTTTDTGDFKVDHKYGQVLEDRATNGDAAIGVYTTRGTSTNSNGTLITIGGVQYLRDIRAENLNLPNVGDGVALDGIPTTGADANEVLVGTDNKDLIYMWAGDDTAYAEAGDDVIYGGGGIDRLYGGDGNDTIYGGDSGDLIDGGAGDDVLWGESSGTAAAGLDQIIGGEGNDIIHGGIGIDKISGGAGDDVIFGEGETDAFTHGGDGNDYLDGGSGGDLLWGDGGDDLIVGGNDQDIVAGLSGDDILRPGNPSSAMGVGPDEVMGGSATDDLGNDDQGHGFDLVDLSDYAASTTGASVTFSTQQNPAGAIDVAAPFAWVGIEGAIGSRNNDTITADSTLAAAPVGLLDTWTDDNWLIGGSGNDMLSGGLGNDVIVGDGIRLDSLIGTYSGAYANDFDGASHRAFGLGSLAGERVIGTNGLLDALGFDKHFTNLLQSDMYKNLELGGSAIGLLNGVAGTRTGDGGVAGTSDTVAFSGNRADYTVTSFDFATANQGTIKVFKIVDNRDPLAVDANGALIPTDATDVVVGVENFKFANGTFTDVTVLNQAPVITSDGGGADAARVVAENSLAVTTVTASDADLPSQALSFSIAGGADAALFAINADGVLSFVSAPNFEAVADAGGNSVYDVVVQVSDGIAVDTQALAVSVTNVNEAATGALNIATYTPRPTANTNAVSLSATNTLADPDVPALAAANQWQRSTNNGTTWTNIAGATGATLTNQSNTMVRVVSTYSDPFGATTVVSPETAVIGNGAGNTLAGTAGNDFQLCLGGNDRLLASAGNDVIDGGAGTDTYSLAATSAAADVNLTAGTASSATTGNDTLVSIENVIGSSAANVITDAIGANVLNGGGGNDTFVLVGDNVRDILAGSAGTDTVDYSAATANLTVNLSNATATVSGSGSNNANSDTVNGVENFIGGSGNDNITGTASANALTGGAGNDTLTGGRGQDMLTGGLGADVFDYNNAVPLVTVLGDSGVGAANRDIITDFLSGTDKLDFSTIDANAGSGGNQAFSAITSAAGSGGFTGAGQLHYFYETVAGQEYTVVEGNTGGFPGNAPDFQVALVGHISLQATDIVV